MSKAQGDGYKTQTNHELNAYRARLDYKLHLMIDEKVKFYRAGTGWILAKEKNTVFNPNGDWKWNGWEITGKQYTIWVYNEDGVRVRDGRCEVVAPALFGEIFTSKDEANEFFEESVNWLKYA